MSSNKCKLSVILPTYNCEKFIEKTLSSVINQTYSNLEIIIVDDCSTDKTREIIKGIQDDRILFMPLKKNIGPGAARNLGISLATGDYLTFMDHDDWQGEHRYENMIRQMEKDGTDVCLSNAQEYIESTNTYKPRYKFNHKNGVIPANPIKTPVPPWNKIHKAYLFKEKKVSFAINSMFDDNMYYALLMSLVNEISYCDDITYIHRTSGTNISRNYLPGSLFRQEDMLKNFTQSLDSPVCKSIQKEKISEYFLHYFSNNLSSFSIYKKLKKLSKEKSIENKKLRGYKIIFSTIRRWFVQIRINKNQYTIKIAGIYLINKSR